MHRSSNPSIRRRQDEGVEAVEKQRMEVDIPRDLAGHVIGKDGATTRRMHNRTGATVHVSTPEVEGGRTFVALTGTLHQVNPTECISHTLSHSCLGQRCIG